MIVKKSVSLAIHDDQRPGQVLLVQRPDDDDDLPLAWGLPAASLLPGESWADAGRRAGSDKLGVALEITGELQAGTLQRASYMLDMRLLGARIVDGLAHARDDVPGVTHYRALRWGTATELQPAADRGSLCSQLYLRWSGGR